jgi:hypothetical protein
MDANVEEQELRERLSLIESMIADGRRSTERWAWSFLLWGIAYYVAFAWAYLGRNWVAWPVTMIAAAAVTTVLAGRARKDRPGTTVGRAICAVWTAMGIALFLLLMGLSLSGRYEAHVNVAIVGAMLAVANGASGIILKWKVQLACALVWLGTALAACFASEAQLAMMFLVAIFFCQIVFGIYGMVAESRRGRQDAVHA